MEPLLEVRRRSCPGRRCGGRRKGSKVKGIRLQAGGAALFALGSEGNGPKPAF